jgi:hypothetical protein
VLNEQQPSASAQNTPQLAQGATLVATAARRPADRRPRFRGTAPNPTTTRNNTLTAKPEPLSTSHALTDVPG